jgi:hypothetical protein
MPCAAYKSEKQKAHSFFSKTIACYYKSIASLQAMEIHSKTNAFRVTFANAITASDPPKCLVDSHLLIDMPNIVLTAPEMNLLQRILLARDSQTTQQGDFQLGTFVLCDTNNRFTFVFHMLW